MGLAVFYLSLTRFQLSVLMYSKIFQSGKEIPFTGSLGSVCFPQDICNQLLQIGGVAMDSKSIPTYSADGGLSASFFPFLSFFFFFNKFILFIYFLIFLAALGLCYCTRAFSSCAARASHCGGFSCCRARGLQ